MSSRVDKKKAQNKVIDLLRAAQDAGKEGARQNELEAALALPQQQVVSILNELLHSGTIQLLQDSATEELVYKLQQEDKVAKLRGLTNTDRAVYQCIEKSGNKGIWTRDMKGETGLNTQQINKCLKELEKRNLVKSVRSVHHTKKVYMLANLEPAKEVSGGFWYTENTLDTELIKVLRATCTSYIADRQTETTGPTLPQICQFIREKGVCTQDLAELDVLQVVRTLLYDGKVVEYEGDEEYQYRLSDWPLDADNGLTDIPCGYCPVIAQCVPGGKVSPETCQYFAKWLAF